LDLLASRFRFFALKTPFFASPEEKRAKTRVLHYRRDHLLGGQSKIARSEL